MGRPADAGSAVADPREVLLSYLKRLRPAKLVAVDADGKEQEVAIPNRRERWAAVARTLDGMVWSQVKCLDAKGALLGVLGGDDDGADDAGGLGLAPKGADREHALLVVLVKAQEQATRAQRDAMMVLVEGYKQLTEMFATRLAALEAVQERTLKLAHDAALATAQPAGGGAPPEDELMAKVLTHAMGGGGDIDAKLEKAVEKVARRFMGGGGGGSAATPPNGKGS